MKITITTDNGVLVHTIKHLETYNLSKSIAQQHIINEIRGAMTTAYWWIKDKEMVSDFTNEELKHLK